MADRFETFCDRAASASRRIEDVLPGFVGYVASAVFLAFAFLYAITIRAALDAAIDAARKGDGG